MTGERDLRQEPAAHRTGNTDPGGKLNNTIELGVTDEMFDEIQRHASAMRVSRAEYIRMCITKENAGRSYLMRRSVGDPET